MFVQNLWRCIFYKKERTSTKKYRAEFKLYPLCFLQNGKKPETADRVVLPILQIQAQKVARATIVQTRLSGLSL